MKKRAWLKVVESQPAKDLQLRSPVECQFFFKYLQDTYVRLKREHISKLSRSGSGAVCVPAPAWHSTSAMQFVDSAIRKRATTSNTSEAICVPPASPAVPHSPSTSSLSSSLPLSASSLPLALSPLGEDCSEEEALDSPAPAILSASPVPSPAAEKIATAPKAKRRRADDVDLTSSFD